MSLSLTKPPRQELELPATNHITPSKINIWRGAKVPGARFTRAQEYQMERFGIDPATVPVVVVRSVATAREMYWPEGHDAPVFVINCPIIRTRASDGFHYVITPSSARTWVHPSGHLKGQPNV